VIDPWSDACLPTWSVSGGQPASGNGNGNANGSASCGGLRSVIAIDDRANVSENESGSASESGNESGYDSSIHCFRNIREKKERRLTDKLTKQVLRSRCGQWPLAIAE